MIAKNKGSEGTTPNWERGSINRLVAFARKPPKRVEAIICIDMKRQIISIEQAFGVDSLRVAESMAGSGEKAKRESVISYRVNLESNLRDLSRRLISGNYVPDPGVSFVIISQGKRRRIHKVGYEARIVDQAIVNAIEPKIRHGLVARTYGCIPGRGGLKASQQLQRDLLKINYFVKADVKKYYPTMLRAVIMKFLNRRFKGSAFLYVVEEVLNSYINEDIPGMEQDGISIGSLKSQIIGNLYLSAFDHYILEDLKICFYVRYVDDMVFGFKTKEEAARVIPIIQKYLSENLGLQLHKIRLAPVGKQIIDFCMHQHRKDRQGKVYIMLRKSVMQHCYSTFRDIEKKWASMTFRTQEDELKYIERERSRAYSYIGYLKHCNGIQTIKIIKNEHNDIFRRVERCAKGARRRQTTNACAA